MTNTTSRAATPIFHPQPYSIKRQRTNIANCDSEPVQIPGCVQAHGALLVLRPADLRVVQASDNVQAVLGLTVESILNQSVAAVLGVDGERQLRDMLGAESLDRNPLYLLSLPLQALRRQRPPCTPRL